MEVWILTFLIIFMLHNLEEIMMVERWMKGTYPQVRGKIPSFAQKELDQVKDMTSGRFAIVVFLLSIFASALLFLSATTQLDFLFFGLNFVFALNIFSHPLQSLFLKSYTPGVGTSIFLVIPYYIFFFYHFYDVFSIQSMIGAFIIVLIFIPVFLLSHKMAAKWA